MVSIENYIPLHMLCSHLGIYNRSTLVYEARETCMVIFIKTLVEGPKVQHFLNMQWWKDLIN